MRGMSKGMSVRNRALEALVQSEKTDTSMKTLLREMQTTSADVSDIQISNFLSLSVIRYQNSIDYLLSKSLGHEKLQNLNARDRNILRLVLYETKWMASDLDTTLSFYPKLKFNHLKAISKALDFGLDEVVQDLPLVNKLSIKYSHPTFLVKTLLDNLSIDETIQVLNANNSSRNYYLRLNKLKNANNSIFDSIEGVKLQPDSTLSSLYAVIEGIEQIVTSKLFQDGFILLQDKASILVVESLDLHSGQVIWDSCAAPGMKTQLIVEKMNSTGKIIASDIYRDRVRAARNRSVHLNANQIEWIHADSTHPVVTRANKILIDAPCTSSGILQSYPSFKWRLNKETLFSLMTVQNKLLESIISAHQNCPGTEIIFSTCSILPHEGESQIDSILSKYNVELLDPILPKSSGYSGFTCSNQVTRLFPHKHKTSGFFIAGLRIKH